MADGVLPQTLRRDGDGLLVTWDDGVTTFVNWRTLRANCPCATCNIERAKPPDPFRVLSPQEVAAGPPDPVAIKPVGRYAYQIAWNDGHDTGIYPLTALRALSQPRAAAPA